MLKTSVERLEGDSVKLTVTVPASEVDEAIAEAYVAIGKKLRIPGFRKGKAPRPVVDNYVGREHVLAEATEELVNKTYPRAIDAEGLRTVEAPEMGELSTVLAGEEYTYETEVELRPELKLSSADDITVTVPSKEATDAEIAEQIDALRERFASLEPVEDRGVQADDFVLVSFTGYVDGEPYEGNVVDKYLYEMGKGLMPVAFDEGLVGLAAGGETRIEFEIPDTSSNPEFVGKKAQFDVTVHEIKSKVLPEVDDDFAVNVGGYDSAEQLRNDIRERLTLQKALAYDRAKEKGAREVLASRTEGEIPQGMILGRAQSVQADFMTRLEQQGTNIEAYSYATGMSSEDIEREIRREAEIAVREDLALESLFRLKGLEITDADLDAELEEIAQATKSSAEDARKKWEDMGLMPVIREGVMHRKAVEWLMENVAVTEESAGSEVEAPSEGTKKAAKKKAPKKAAAPKAKAESADEPVADAESTEE